MRTETLSRIPFKEQVKRRFGTTAEHVKKREKPSLYPLTVAFLNKADSIDWDRRRPDAEINSILSSTAAAVHYAHIKTGRTEEYLQHFRETDPQQWEVVINNVLTDDTMSNIFYENLGRQATTVSPSRGIPLQYILRDLSERVDHPLVGIDLGAGAHIAIPLLNTPFYTIPDFTHKESLVQRFGNNMNVDIALGLGVDRQNIRDDTAWIKACIWPSEEYRAPYEQIDAVLAEVLTKDKKKYPFVTFDVTAADFVEKIQTELPKTNGIVAADFIFTSFMRHQIGNNDFLHQNPLLRTIKNLLYGQLLAPGGIWIDIGDELLTGDFQKSSHVNVYEKHFSVTSQNNYPVQHLSLRGTPFILRDQQDIEEADLNYFL